MINFITLWKLMSGLNDINSLLKQGHGQSLRLFIQYSRYLDITWIFPRKGKSHHEKNGKVYDDLQALNHIWYIL